MNQAGFRVTPLVIALVTAAAIWYVFFSFFFTTAEPREMEVNSFFLRYPPAGAEAVALSGFLVVGAFLFLLHELWIRHSRGAARLALTAALIAILFTAPEMAVKNFVSRHPMRFMPDPALIWRLTPHFGVPGDGGTNSQGFRCRELPVEKSGGEYRIALLGDSSANGFAVRDGERFSDLLEAELSARYGKKTIRVINAAVDGYSSFQARQLFFERVERLAPDCAILSINNDMGGDFAPDSARVSSGLVLAMQRLLYQSDLYLILHKQIVNGRMARARPGGAPTALRVSFDEARRNYGDVVRAMKERGGSAIIVSMPMAEEGGSAYAQSVIAGHRRVMAEVCRAHGALLVNLYDEWRKDPSTRPLMHDSVHPNAEGHSRIAAELCEAVVKAHLVK